MQGFAAAKRLKNTGLEYQQDLIINFIDFKKAFDSVHRPSLWKFLTYYGIPDWFINIFKALYDNSSCCVKTASGYKFFEIVFIIVINFVMCRTTDKSEYGIVWQKQNRLMDLDFADDIAIVSRRKRTYARSWLLSSRNKVHKLDWI